MTIDAFRSGSAETATAYGDSERARVLSAWLAAFRHPDRFGLAALIAVMVALMSLGGGGVTAGTADGYRSGSSTAPVRAGDAERHEIATAPAGAVRGCRPPSAPRGDDGPAAFLPTADFIPVMWNAGSPAPWQESDRSAGAGRLGGCSPTGPPAA